jgi:UV DNA damage endonuclease
MKIGYPCINLSLTCRSSRTFRLASYSEDRIRATVKNNLDCLMDILKFNVEKDLLFFRITSDLIPFASHQICEFPWKKEFKKEFQRIGNYIKKNRIRVAMHPGQYTLINSPDRGVFERSVSELVYHAEVLDLLGTDPSAKIQIHVGGVYGNKEESMNRFVIRYKKLPLKIRKRLVIENDDRMYSAKDCIAIHQETGIPVLFDLLHHICNSGGEKIIDAFISSHATWKLKDGPPIVDYSSQEKSKRKGAHVLSIDLRKFRHFINQTKGFDFDIMCEIKDKEQSAIRALGVMRSFN